MSFINEVIENYQRFAWNYFIHFNFSTLSTFENGAINERHPITKATKLNLKTFILASTRQLHQPTVANFGAAGTFIQSSNNYNYDNQYHTTYNYNYNHNHTKAINYLKNCKNLSHDKTSNDFF